MNISNRPPTAWLRNIIIVAVAGGLLTTGLFWIFGGANTSKTKNQLTYTVSRGDFVVSVNEEGRLESANNTEIKCMVKGGSTILWIIPSGETVKTDQVLVRLDQSAIEDDISQKTIALENARATMVKSENDVKDAQISIEEYKQALFPSEVKTAERDLAVSKAAYQQTVDYYAHTQRLAAKGMVSNQQLRADSFNVEKAKLDLEIQETTLEGLKKFTKRKRLQELDSTLKAANATHASNVAKFKLEESRLERAKKMLANCTIKAKKPGMVLYPRAAEWKGMPEIEEGATAREKQLLLVMPDLKEMQIKVGIHESKIKRLSKGAVAEIKLLGKTYIGKVKKVATVAAPAGWWNGNAVKYDTIVSIEAQAGLKPGMSAEVEIFLAKYVDVLNVPVASVVELKDGFYCFVKTGAKPERRKVKLGDSNDNFVVIESGLSEGEQIFLNARELVDPAELRGDASETEKKATPKGIQNLSSNQKKTKPDANDDTKTKPKKKKSSALKTAKAKLKAADANGDGFLAVDELDEPYQQRFDKIDKNDDEKIDLAELTAEIQATGTE